MASSEAKPATIREVARAAGVSVGTVSRSLNAPDTVRRATLARVQAAIGQLGFKPDPRAQGMRRRNTLAVGFISNDISNPVHAVVFRGAETELRGRGYSLLVVNSGGHRHPPAWPRRRADHDHQQRAGPALPRTAGGGPGALGAARPRDRPRAR